jgi:hypothetical protein
LFINVFKLHPYICNVKYLFLFLPLFIWSCKEQVAEDEQTITEQQPATKGKQSLASYADRMVRAKLGIQANEKFELKIYRAQLDADGIEDAIITVNRHQLHRQRGVLLYPHERHGWGAHGHSAPGRRCRGTQHRGHQVGQLG